MKKVVVIDDDPKLRSLMRVRLQSTYELFDTGDPAEAFGPCSGEQAGCHLARFVHAGTYRF